MLFIMTTSRLIKLFSQETLSHPFRCPLTIFKVRLYPLNALNPFKHAIKLLKYPSHDNFKTKLLSHATVPLTMLRKDM